MCFIHRTNQIDVWNCSVCTWDRRTFTLLLLNRTEPNQTKPNINTHTHTQSSHIYFNQNTILSASMQSTSWCTDVFKPNQILVDQFKTMEWNETQMVTQQPRKRQRTEAVLYQKWANKNLPAFIFIWIIYDMMWMKCRTRQCNYHMCYTYHNLCNVFV